MFLCVCVVIKLMSSSIRKYGTARGIYVCMCVCVCVCVYVCACVHACLCVCTRTPVRHHKHRLLHSICVCASMYVYIHVCGYVTERELQPPHHPPTLLSHASLSHTHRAASKTTAMDHGGNRILQPLSLLCENVVLSGLRRVHLRVVCV